MTFGNIDRYLVTKKEASFRVRILLYWAERRDGIKLDSWWHQLSVWTKPYLKLGLPLPFSFI